MEPPAALKSNPDATQHSEWHHVTMNMVTLWQAQNNQRPVCYQLSVIHFCAKLFVTMGASSPGSYANSLSLSLENTSLASVLLRRLGK